MGRDFPHWRKQEKSMSEVTKWVTTTSSVALLTTHGNTPDAVVPDPRKPEQNQIRSDVRTKCSRRGPDWRYAEKTSKEVFRTKKPQQKGVEFKNRLPNKRVGLRDSTHGVRRNTDISLKVPCDSIHAKSCMIMQDLVCDHISCKILHNLVCEERIADFLPRNFKKRKILPRNSRNARSCQEIQDLCFSIQDLAKKIKSEFLAGSWQEITLSQQFWAFWAYWHVFGTKCDFLGTWTMQLSAWTPQTFVVSFMAFPHDLHPTNDLPTSLNFSLLPSTWANAGTSWVVLANISLSISC